ncbi:MAG: hypothetical protein WBA57_23200 [Elainellaceae cyanobacterium]
MNTNSPLQGTELISCAKSIAIHGADAAAKSCGYGDDIDSFEKNLFQACEEAGIHIKGLGDLVNRDQVKVMHQRKSS